MLRIIKKTVNPQTQNNETYRKTRRVIIPILVVISISLLACPLHIAGLSVIDEEKLKSIVATATEGSAQLLMPEEADPTPDQSIAIQEPDNQPEELQSSEPVTNNGGTSEYSVSAQDFNCTCQVDGNVNVELRVNGDQLEIVDAGGGVEVYDKISENTYKKSWMGFYYLTTQDGNTTKVDEERSVVIILNNDGYIMEHYQGSESSPCCIHTFTDTN